MKKRYLLVLLFCFRGLISFGQQDTLELYIPDTSILLGNTAKIEVRVNNFTDILSMQASVNWNPELMTFVEISDFGLKGLGANNFGTTNADQGHVRFVWEPSDAVAQSLPDSSTLFSMSFEYSGVEPGVITLDFEDKTSNPAFPIEFANSSYELLNVRDYQGTVTYYEVITSLHDEILETLVYPNPFDDILFVRNEAKEIDFIKVYNQFGELITEIYNPENQLVNVPIASESAGIFLINLKINDQVFTKKLVKYLYP